MSNFNYMENVPVKISEKYKPPPRIYQLPQSVTNKLNLPDGLFHDSAQYMYDFQLERKVLAKIPEYKRKRQIEREARQERRERREKERQRKIEQQQKQMLGAVSYPNAAELSSGDSDDDDDSEKPNGGVKDLNWLGSHSFDNILQPTVLAHYDGSNDNNIGDDGLPLQHGQNRISSCGNSSNNACASKLGNTFNYKDFEEDTSSPFDNIELKTINDLDILRQVLHNTQLRANKDKADSKDSIGVENNSENDEIIMRNTKGNIENNTHVIHAISADDDSDAAPQLVSDIATIESTKAALEKVNFSDINLGLEQQQPTLQQIDNIPTHHYKDMGNYYCLSAAPSLPSSARYIQDCSNNMRQQDKYQVSHHNQLFSPNCNSNASPFVHKTLNQYSNLNSVVSPHQMQYIFNNANNLLPKSEQFNTAAAFPNDLQVQEEDAQSTKSRSVPDLFQELRDEVRNSEMRRRRSRNYSHNFDGSKELSDEEKNDKTLENNSPENLYKDTLEAFNKLTMPLKTLARNISSMGFPLGRVAKIAQIYGENDKKIVEHLIPLTELLDLGFDETLISEALLKFDNNKDKALEHLIK